jgi:hypothetical protein
MLPYGPCPDNLPALYVKLIRTLLAYDTAMATVIQIFAGAEPERRLAVEREVARVAKEMRTMRN